MSIIIEADLHAFSPQQHGMIFILPISGEGEAFLLDECAAPDWQWTSDPLGRDGKAMFFDCRRTANDIVEAAEYAGLSVAVGMPAG